MLFLRCCQSTSHSLCGSALCFDPLGPCMAFREYPSLPPPSESAGSWKVSHNCSQKWRIVFSVCRARVWLLPLVFNVPMHLKGSGHLSCLGNHRLKVKSSLFLTKYFFLMSLNIYLVIQAFFKKNMLPLLYRIIFFVLSLKLSQHGVIIFASKEIQFKKNTLSFLSLRRQKNKHKFLCSIMSVSLPASLLPESFTGGATCGQRDNGDQEGFGSFLLGKQERVQHSTGLLWPPHSLDCKVVLLLSHTRSVAFQSTLACLPLEISSEQYIPLNPPGHYVHTCTLSQRCLGPWGKARASLCHLPFPPL